ncbi:MAG: entry exclusion lipoprotein TrbK [Hydrogenophilales bacterium 17-61-9]|nr:MAG: entry exclusion lipoprotein TrbK [Hydrogenophilales bacterium 16-62-9]OZA30051.1 MAG: entry exclusion lipoprotein TrbK [Hydrogenophilales bacterium 17-61-9]
MKKSGMLLLVLVLTACEKPVPTDTIESLVANPERLKEVERLCREDHAKMGDALCNAASEARRRRFMGDGKSKYTPQPAPQN